MGPHSREARPAMLYSDELNTILYSITLNKIIPRWADSPYFAKSASMALSGAGRS